MATGAFFVPPLCGTDLAGPSALLGSLAFRSVHSFSALLHQSKSCQVNSSPGQEGGSIKNPLCSYIALAGDPPDMNPELCLNRLLPQLCHPHQTYSDGCEPFCLVKFPSLCALLVEQTP